VSKTILLCTLGASWAVIPEIYGFLAPERLPLFEKHPEKKRLDALRRQWQLLAPDEIWVVTTEGAKTIKSLEALFSWWQLLGGPVPLRVWQASGTNELAGEEECKRIRELTLRTCLHAVAVAGGKGQVLLSLAGGRKTMSADLQWAGSIFGCHALLHVVDNGDFPKELRLPTPGFMTGPLPIEINGKACVGVVTPLVVGRGYHSDFLDVDWNDRGPVTAGRFPLPGVDSLLSDEKIRCLSCLVGNSDIKLVDEIEAREKEGQQLLGNYLAAVSRDEHHENWRSLYRLPPRIIEHLRNTVVNEGLKDILYQVPKADIHCHLGGILGLDAQIRVGLEVWNALSSGEKAAALRQVSKLLKTDDWPWEWPDFLREGDRSANTAALLTNLEPDKLKKILYAGTQPRFALVKKNEHGFAAYERPGELTGSAILGRPEGVLRYAQEVFREVSRQRLLYCELRGSPIKYLGGNGLEFLRLFCHGLKMAAKNLNIDAEWLPSIRFVIITDRRDATPAGEENIRKGVDLAVMARKDEQLKNFVVGLDLAGDEKIGQFDKIKRLYEPAFAECLPVTIHAGETTKADKIWKAAYQLNADRIGHGLSLVENPALANRFRDRNICLEMCPTSNMEVVGFTIPEKKCDDNDDPLDVYPLKELWDKGLPLTLCTDNPGISRTTLTGEYLEASRLTPGGLSLWDTLAMIKQAFSHAFLPAGERETLIKKADKIIYRQMLTGFAG